MAQNRYFWAMLGLGNLEEYCWKLQNEHFRASAWNADNEIQGEIIKKNMKTRGLRHVRQESQKMCQPFSYFIAKMCWKKWKWASEAPKQGR